MSNNCSIDHLKQLLRAKLFTLPCGDGRKKQMNGSTVSRYVFAQLHTLLPTPAIVIPVSPSHLKSTPDIMVSGERV